MQNSLSPSKNPEQPIKQSKEIQNIRLPENCSELDEINKLTEESGPGELISAALKAYRKLQKQNPGEALEELKMALLKQIKEEAEDAPFYRTYPDIAPAVFEFWAEAESFEASNEYLQKTLYGMPYNALELLYCYRNKEGGSLDDPEALRKDPALLFGEQEYAALAKVMKPALVFRALHLVRAIKKMNVLGAGVAEVGAEKGDAIDFELIEELISGQFMKIYG
ncbi:MAG: hypothetical protein PHV51_09995 [Methanosarcinaceae archaeon]|nr:hypothetical protein [Methanosarcinaceae archaeon]